MPYKITNVSLEHQHSLKRRTATRLQMEPLVAGKRLMLRQSITISDEQYEINKADLEQYVKDGIVSVESTMPFVPLRMPETPSMGEVRELSTDVASLDETQDFPDLATTPSVIPQPPIATNQPNPLVTNPQPSGSSYPRRDDKKRGR